jgi:hypothetical protein
MIISATGGKKDFAPCPEFSGRAVCVDVTPLKEYETQYGVKQKFKFVFEIDLQDDSRDPVQPWVVMTKPMVPSLHEKAALTKFLKDWFGRKLTDVENKSLDLESLLGRPASIVIGHEQSEDGSKTYANIKHPAGCGCGCRTVLRRMGPRARQRRLRGTRASARPPAADNLRRTMRQRSRCTSESTRASSSGS